jgi:hypothetical protein
MFACGLSDILDNRNSILTKSVLTPVITNREFYEL